MKTIESLPMQCYGTLGSTGEIVVIKRGERGYYQTDIDAGSKDENKKLVDELNEKLGINKAQAQAMSVGSMFGWGVPGADPSIYDENGLMKKDSLADKIASAEQEKTATDSKDVELGYGEMKKLFKDVENTHKGHVCGHIVFSADSFTEPYSEEARTYVVSSNNKAFQSNMGGYSIYGSSLDGSDVCVRLEQYMDLERGGKDGWKVERCYMKRDEFDIANKIIGEKGHEEER